MSMVTEAQIREWMVRHDVDPLRVCYSEDGELARLRVDRSGDVWATLEIPKLTDDGDFVITRGEILTERIAIPFDPVLT